MVELMIVLLLLGIVTAATAPRFHRFLAEQAVKSAAQRIQADLAFAKRRAKTTSLSQQVRFFTWPARYDMPGVSDPDHPARDYVVSLTSFPYTATIQAVNFGGDAVVIFNIHGLPDSGGTIQVKVGNYSRTIELNAANGETSIL